MCWWNRGRNEREVATPVDQAARDEAYQAYLTAQRNLRITEQRTRKIDAMGLEVEKVAASHRNLLAQNHFGEAIKDSFGLRRA
jgi:hypothetical protein